LGKDINDIARKVCTGFHRLVLVSLPVKTAMLWLICGASLIASSYVFQPNSMSPGYAASSNNELTDLSGKADDLSSQSNGLSNQIKSLETQISDAQNRISSLSNEIQSLQNQLPTLNNEITQLQQLADFDSHLGAPEPTRWNGL